MASITISNKGQITIPLDIRKEHELEEGTKVNIQSTPWGISLIKVPSKPLFKLRGVLKDVSISSKDIKRMRKEDDKIRESKILKI